MGDETGETLSDGGRRGEVGDGRSTVVCAGPSTVETTTIVVTF